MATPAQLEALARQAEQKYGLPQGMLVAQLRQESSDGRNTANPEGPVGVMQMQPGTARSLGVDPNDPAQAIDGAGRLMAQNMKQAGGNPSKALELYYGGPNTAAHGPRTKAYPGQVGNRWDDGDAFEAASTFTPQKDPDADSFETAANFGSGNAPPAQNAFLNAVESGPDTERKTQFEKGLETLRTKPNLTLDDIASYYHSGGYDSSSPQFKTQATAWLKSSMAHRGTVLPQAPNAVVREPSTLDSLTTGAKQGVDDVVASGRQFVNYMDAKYPVLNDIDKAAGTIAPGLDPEKSNQLVGRYRLSRNAFDDAYSGDLTASVGRVGGQIAGSVPLMVATDGLVNPIAARVGAAPVVDYLAGRGGSNLLTRIGSRAIGGARAGGEGAALTSASSDQSLGDQVKTGMEVGGTLGPVFGALGWAGNKITSAVAPGIDADTARLAQTASDKYGLNFSGAQISRSPLVRRIDAQLETSPGTGVAERNAGQREQFGRAVARTFGADDLSPASMSKAKSAISDTYNDVANRTTIDVHPDRGSPFVDNLAHIQADATGVLDTTKQPALGRLIDNVLEKVSPEGTIDGRQFKILTSRGSMLDNATRDTNSSFANAAKAIKRELNSALSASAAPEDVAALKSADRQWKNMRTVQRLAANSPDGTITPAGLQNAVTTSFKDRAYTGAGDLGELGDIGKRFMQPPSSSGTAENIRAQKLLERVGGGMGLGTGIVMHQLGAPLGADVASGLAVAGMGTANSAKNVLLAKLLNSSGYRNRLLGAALNDNNALPRVNAMNGLPTALIVSANDLARRSSTQQGQ